MCIPSALKTISCLPVSLSVGVSTLVCSSAATQIEDIFHSLLFFMLQLKLFPFEFHTEDRIALIRSRSANADII